MFEHHAELATREGASGRVDRRRPPHHDPCCGYGRQPRTEPWAVNIFVVPSNPSTSWPPPAMRSNEPVSDVARSEKVPVCTYIPFGRNCPPNQLVNVPAYACEPPRVLWRLFVTCLPTPVIVRRESLPRLSL